MAVVIETTLGDITVDLFVKERPTTCLNFLKLCKMKYYNFNLFHSIRSGFIAQTGDPTGEGTGGQSIWGLLEGPEKRFFSGEKMPKIRHTDAGLLSMVCTGDALVGSQFFFSLAPDLDSLDGVHCVIGEVTEGQEVLRKLNDVICDETHRPYQDVRITHTIVLEDPFSDPMGLLGPSRSPSPSAERLQGGRIAPDEDLDEGQGKSAQELQDMIEEKEAKARATILEIVGDLPDADIAPPENVLFVCKLNPVTTDEDLEIIFSRFGTIVTCEVIRDKKTGDSLQYAFIEFSDKKSCEDAYFKMDNVLIDDRRIHVDFSQSVSKMKWLGKGRGVKHFTNDETRENKNNANMNRSRSSPSKSRQNRDQPQERGREYRNRDPKHDKESDRRNKEGNQHENRRRSKSRSPQRDRRERKRSDRDRSFNQSTEKRSRQSEREPYGLDNRGSSYRNNESSRNDREKSDSRCEARNDSRRESNPTYKREEKSKERDSDRNFANGSNANNKERPERRNYEATKETNSDDTKRRVRKDDAESRKEDLNKERSEKRNDRENPIESTVEKNREYARLYKGEDSNGKSDNRDRIEIGNGRNVPYESKNDRYREIATCSKDEYVHKNRDDRKRSERRGNQEPSQKDFYRDNLDGERNDCRRPTEPNQERNKEYLTQGKEENCGWGRTVKRNNRDRPSPSKNKKQHENSSQDQDSDDGRGRPSDVRKEPHRDTSQDREKQKEPKGSKEHDNKKKSKTGPKTPSPVVEKSNKKESDKNEEKIVKKTNSKKKRKVSTSSSSSSSDSSSSSSEDDRRAKKSKRKRKHSTTSDSSSSSSSSNSSSDSSSDSSSSSDSEPQRKVKKTSKKPVKKSKKK